MMMTAAYAHVKNPKDTDGKTINSQSQREII
jgi:hypothetical protein